MKLSSDEALSLVQAQEPGSILITVGFVPIQKVSDDLWEVYNVNLQTAYEWNDSDAAVFIVSSEVWGFS